MPRPDVYVPWDGWKVKDRLGTGSFGTVYEIEKREGGKLFRAAMKVISIDTDSIDDMYGSGYNADTARKIAEDCFANLRREYDIMYELRGNPNIVKCDDMKVVGHRDGIGCDVYIRMELLTPLHKMMNRLVGSEDEIIALGRDICNALEALARHHIIHRDIKPNNILVTKNGTYKLGDFGTARSFEHTTSATMAGTETYMAPEVLFRKKYGRDVDTYSLGLVMYRLLNKGQLPFLDPDRVPTPAEREKAIQRRLDGEALPAPATGSRALQTVVLKACSYRREDRYAAAADMRDDLMLAEEGTIPMFHDRAEDTKTVIDETAVNEEDRTQTMPDGMRPGSRKGGAKKTADGKGGARKTGGKGGVKNTGDRKGGTKNTDGGDRKGLFGLSRKAVATIAVVILAITTIAAALLNQAEPTPTPEPEPAPDPDPAPVAEEVVSAEGTNTENFLNAFLSGNYDEAESWGSKNPEYYDEGTVINMPSDIFANYESTTRQYANDPDGFTGSYGFTDIDNDGTPEMVLFTPGSAADMKLKVFTYDSGNVTEVGELSGSHTSVYAYPGHNGMVLGWGHMGVEAYSVVSIENGELKTKDYGSRELGETGEFIYPGNAVSMHTIE